MEEERKLLTKEETIKLIKHFVIVGIIIAIFVVVIHLINQPKEEPVDVNFSGIDRICELATLKCYYHNVAVIEDDPDGIFQYGFIDYGYKRCWFEYYGIIEMGIEANDVQVNEPDSNNNVQIYVPEAKILNVDVDMDSMSDPIVDTGVFTKITFEEKTNAFSAEQETMEMNAKNDKSLYEQAHNNAKKLIEQYVVNVGKQAGYSYTVEWIDKPKSN